MVWCAPVPFLIIIPFRSHPHHIFIIYAFRMDQIFAQRIYAVDAIEATVWDRSVWLHLISGFYHKYSYVTIVVCACVPWTLWINSIGRVTQHRAVHILCLIIPAAFLCTEHAELYTSTAHINPRYCFFLLLCIRVLCTACTHYARG